jgi:hypothetical protein
LSSAAWPGDLLGVAARWQPVRPHFVLTSKPGGLLCLDAVATLGSEVSMRSLGGSELIGVPTCGLSAFIGHVYPK